MEHLMSYFALLITSISSVRMQPTTLMVIKREVIPEGKPCTTEEGHKGFLRDLISCQELVLNGNSVQAHHHEENVTEQNVVVCCSVLSRGGRDDVSNRWKRQAADLPPPPTDIPNLRVKGCGVRGALTDFIVGGRMADSWPWMTGIFVKPNGARTSRFVCGGAVINKRFVLTAAHCLGQRGRTVPARSVTIRVGSLKRSEGTAFPVSSVIVHENYRDNLHYDDIALLKTARDIEAKQVAPVCLPSPGMFNANFFQRQATVLGWGDVSYGGTASDALMQATVPVIPNKRCGNRYRRLGSMSLPRGIIETQLCAGAQNGSIDACQGDSGGPLLLQDRGGKWNIVGIVSFGYRCGEPDYPGVYTRVAKYLKWLQANTDIVPRFIF